jgi:hypothetical protein
MFLLFPLPLNKNSFLSIPRNLLNLLNSTKTPALCGQYLDNSPYTLGHPGEWAGWPRYSCLSTPFIFPTEGKETRKEST